MTVKALKKQLMAAIAMVVVSAIALSSSTYAWFSMNTQVTATGMQVKAVAEDGIVISNSAKSSWTNSASAVTGNVIELNPTSQKAADPTTWYHAKSTAADDAEAHQAKANYSALTIAYSTPAGVSTPAEGVGYVNGSATGYTAEDDTEYVLLSNFYIKSSGDELTSQDLYINDVTVAGADHKIDCALRVLIVVGGNAYLYAPVSADGGTPTYTYNWYNDTSVTARAATDYDVKCVDNGTISNTDDGATLAQVYVFFEGEDANCKSSNISGITTAALTVTVNFGTVSTHSN